MSWFIVNWPYLIILGFHIPVTRAETGQKYQEQASTCFFSPLIGKITQYQQSYSHEKVIFELFQLYIICICLKFICSTKFSEQCWVESFVVLPLEATVYFHL